MTTALLREAADLISDRARWTQGCSAVSSRGDRVSVLSPDAVAWCASGAIRRLTDSPTDGGEALHFLDRAAREFGQPSVMTLNDTSNHETVVLMFVRAIALSEGR